MNTAPQLRHFAELKVKVDPPQEIGHAQHGQRRVIPIIGGTVQGDGWRGKVLPGGADYQLILTPRMADLDAHYVLEMASGELIYVHNRAIRVAEPEITERLIKGEPVDPAEIYFRCCPTFETDAPSMRWITERLFIGTGIRRPDLVEMNFYEVL
ncbi:DUF3237 domain-containing protein [Amphritea pacifica]|uniref:UPF0311 protein JW498_15670 n=1 Tax=Amphritea pacifica TaxID=2811233 RepID=A0ABS2WAU9_9GAMM|nr:DUF3237 domain-containing protein [Amphritea pacifica]MBN0988809.1 DUF3237 domain-containing protein [Amphritea pacifica]